MRGYRYAGLGLFAASVALAANCGFPTSGESTGGAGSGSSTTSSTSSTSGSSSTTSSTGPGGAACTSGQTRDCYTGPQGTEGLGPCVGGKETCSDGMWSTTCTGETTPLPQNCASTVDVDCLGMPVACSGAPVWAEAFGAADADFINAVAVDAQGNVIVTGGFSDTVNFGTVSVPVTVTAYADNHDDIFVAKYTSAGALVWVKAYGGPGQDEGRGVAVDTNGDIVVVGYFDTSVGFGSPATTFAGNNVDAFVLKLSGADGSTTWAQAYGDMNPSNGTSQRADAVAIDANLDVAVVGNFANSIDFGGSNTLSNGSMTNYDAYVLELDSMGNYKWSQDVHGDSGGFDWLKGVACDGTSNVVVTGVGTGTMLTFGTGFPNVMSTGGPNDHILVGKYNDAGAPQWGLALGNDNPGGLPRHEGNGIAADAAGNIVVTGAFASNMQFPTGTMLMPKGTTDIFVAKLDATGNATWSTSFGGMSGNADAATAVAIDQFGNVVLAGSYQGTLSVGTIPITLKAQGMTDAFAVKLDPGGTALWAQGFAADTGSTAFAWGVAVNQVPQYMENVGAGTPVVAGQFGMTKGDTISFGLTAGPLSSQGGSDMFLASLMP